MHIGEVFCKIPGETRRSEKIIQYFKELSKQLLSQKIAKISTSKGQFERAKHPHKTTFENLKIPTKKHILKLPNKSPFLWAASS
jgi:hypothetical protein